MIQHNETESDIREGQLQQLISELGNKDGMLRRHARRELERAGRQATPYLIQSMENPKDNIRWEAAKALVRIEDPEAAPVLVRALMDESFEVQWLAAEALIALGEGSLIPLMEGLVSNYDSIYMRQGAHHVLHNLERRKLLPPPAQKVLDEVRCIEPLEPYPVVAKRALKKLSQKDDEAQSTNQN